MLSAGNMGFRTFVFFCGLVGAKTISAKVSLATAQTKTTSTDERVLSNILREGVRDKVFPGVGAIVGTVDGTILFEGYFGSHAYPEDVRAGEYPFANSAISKHTIFDIASVSKVFATTTAVALLYERGYLLLDTRIADILGSEYGNTGGKGSVTVLNCLLHNAGYKPDPYPMYWTVEFGCPNTADELPAEDFSCIDDIYTSFLAEKLVTAPGESFVYSDLSFITLQMVVGTLAIQHDLVPQDDEGFAACFGGQDKPGTVHRRDSARGNTAATAATAVNARQIVCAFEAFVRTQVFHRTQPVSLYPSSSAARFRDPGDEALRLQQRDTALFPANDEQAGTATFGGRGGPWYMASAGRANEHRETSAFETNGEESLLASAGGLGQQWLPHTGYRPSEDLWSYCVPTLNDTGSGSYTHKRIRGQVADGDCYAMGGIAGHAGVFTTVQDVAAFSLYMLQQRTVHQRRIQAGTTGDAAAATAVDGALPAAGSAEAPFGTEEIGYGNRDRVRGNTAGDEVTTARSASFGGEQRADLDKSENARTGRGEGELGDGEDERVERFLDPSTVALFTTVHNASQSSRALGWSTNSFESADYGYDHSCGDMSEHTFMHIGYTGTCICIDPLHGMFSVIFTNRVYNCDKQACDPSISVLVKDVYRRFNSAAVHLAAEREEVTDKQEQQGSRNGAI